MSTSTKRSLSALITYILLSAFCYLFSIIYEHYSHGVYSDYITKMFLIPLILGGVPSLILLIFSKIYIKISLARVFHLCGIATLTIGSCIKGILEIYGTTSESCIIYYIAGITLLVASLVSMIIELLK